LTRAKDRLTDLQGQLAAAQLRTGDATTVIEQRYSVVDEPRTPGASEPRFQQAVFTLGLFAVLGVIVAVGLLVLAAALDRTVRVPNDITAHTGLDVLAVVPNIGR
jgi:capsular polysaccharide biosynthesis protein